MFKFIKLLKTTKNDKELKTDVENIYQMEKEFALVGLFFYQVQVHFYYGKMNFMLLPFGLKVDAQWGPETQLNIQKHDTSRSNWKYNSSNTSETFDGQHFLTRFYRQIFFLQVQLARIYRWNFQKCEKLDNNRRWNDISWWLVLFEECNRTLYKVFEHAKKVCLLQLPKNQNLFLVFNFTLWFQRDLKNMLIWAFLKDRTSVLSKKFKEIRQDFDKACKTNKILVKHTVSNCTVPVSIYFY